LVKFGLKRAILTGIIASIATFLGIGFLAPAMSQSSYTPAAIQHPSSSINSASQGDSSPAPVNPVASLFEYKFTVKASDIFPSDKVKSRVLDAQQESKYQLAKLSYNILGQHINASNVTVYVRPSKVDDDQTRLDLYILAKEAKVTGADGHQGVLDKTLQDVELKSIYGVYSKSSDEITMHVPYAVALAFIG